jgi:hypothetical protein
MCWRYRIKKKQKTWKKDGKMLQFIIDFMRVRTLRVAVGSTLSDEGRIENGVVHRAVLWQETPTV